MSLQLLGAALVVLMIDSAIELAFISSMVGYLHRSGANQYIFDIPDGSALINAKPKHLLLNEGHTSNGAAGTSLVLICFGGFLVLWRERMRERNNKSARGPSKIFLVYTIFTILAFLLNLSALAYTFAVSHQTSGQSIDSTVAEQYQSHAYPLYDWTPQTWTKALLDLPVTDEGQNQYLRGWLRVMEGWKWNLIPMFLINLVVAALAVNVCSFKMKESRIEYARAETVKGKR